MSLNSVIIYVEKYVSIFAASHIKVKKYTNEEKTENCQSEVMSIGMCLGVAFGTTGACDLAVGMSLGMLLGLVTGMNIKNNYPVFIHKAHRCYFQFYTLDLFLGLDSSNGKKELLKQCMDTFYKRET